MFTQSEFDYYRDAVGSIFRSQDRQTLAEANLGIVEEAMLCGFSANISSEICALCLLTYKSKVLGTADEITYHDTCLAKPRAKK
jgi:hypothetical protein